MRTRRQIAEGRRRDRAVTAGRLIVLCRPGARIQLVMEGVVIRAGEVRQHLEAYVCRLRQGEVDDHLIGRGIRRRAEVLVRAVVRPFDGLTARGRRIVHHHKRGKRALAREAFQLYHQ
jgi:hypothetical protein